MVEVQVRGDWEGEATPTTTPEGRKTSSTRPLRHSSALHRIESTVNATPVSHTHARTQDVAKRPPGPPNAIPAKLGDWLGISGWGFTKRNEVRSGRGGSIPPSQSEGG